MRMILDTVVNNSKLPYIDPVLQMVNSNTLAVYDMTSKADVSGRSAPLVTKAQFDQQGVILTNDANGVIKTGVMQTEKMTIILVHDAHRIESQNSVLLSNFGPAAAPFAGMRLTSPATGTEQAQLGTGRATGEVYKTVTDGFTGGTGGKWLATAYVWDQNDKIYKWFMTDYQKVTPFNVKPVINPDLPFYLNGMPEDVSTDIRGGYTGHIGIAAFYDTNFNWDKPTVQALMQKGIDVMAKRGVTVPVT